MTRLRLESSAGQADNCFPSCTLMTLELWCRTFLDRHWTFENAEPGLPLASQTATGL